MLRRKPSALSTEDGSEIDLRVAMARQYIADNIELHPTIEEVAAYCYLGTKQLTRMFLCAEGMTLNAYIREQKIAHIRRLLSDSDLPLSEISDRMQFSSEYYFNTYFKSHTGMTPGKYRQMMKDNARYVVSAHIKAIVEKVHPGDNFNGSQLASAFNRFVRSKFGLSKLADLKIEQRDEALELVTSLEKLLR
jgi:AraC-like DNA-binding protein